MTYQNLNHKELILIQNFIKENSILIHQDNNFFIIKDLTPIILSINNKEYTIQVYDEYQDFAIKNELLNFIAVFMELAIIDESIDFLDWCSIHGLPPDNSELLNYYKNISIQIDEIRLLFKNNQIDYFISDLDFQLNAGVIQFLRK